MSRAASGQRADRVVRGPARRCVATGAVEPRAALVRFALAPDGRVVPDLSARLPGRGVWVAARREAVARAQARNLFARGLGAEVETGEDLPGRVEALLARHALELIGLARRAGAVAIGFEAVRALAKAGEAGLVVIASDAAAGGRAKLSALAGRVPVIGVFDAAELGQAVGRETVVNLAVREGGMARRIEQEVARLAGFRPLGEDAPPGETRA